MSLFVVLIVLSSFFAILMLSRALINSKKKNKNITSVIDEYTLRYKPIIDIDEEIKGKREKFSNEKFEIQKNIDELKKELSQIKQEYIEGKELFEKLNDQNNLLKDTLEIAEFGVYEPHFDIDTSEAFKKNIKENKEFQKELIKDEQAVICNTNWSVGNSEKKGQIMVKRAIKLTLRAFNGECDTLIAKVKWNNIEQFDKRIKKTFEAINKLNKSQDIHIQDRYLRLKIQELRLTHEFELKKQEEKEEQRRIREQIREEEKARRDFEKARKEAQKEEKLLQDAMEKARNEILKSSEEDKAKYEDKLAKLQEQLKIAEEKNQRAISMAQRQNLDMYM